MTIYTDLLRGISQLIYPNLCWACHTVSGPSSDLFCGECLPKLIRDPFPTCPRCSSSVGPHTVLTDGCPQCSGRSFAFDGAFRLAPYDGLLREVILRMKSWTGEDLAEALASVWANAMTQRVASLAADFVVPIPLHWSRRWRRGFNQSETLARVLANTLHVPYLPRLLRRSRATSPQSAQTGPTGRFENVRNAFDIRGSVDLQGKSIFLVDDILTTGATASEAAKALRAQKTKSIHVVVVAHGK